MIAELIARHHEGWEGPFVEDEVFGHHDPALIAQRIASLVGEPIAHAVFYEAHVGIVAGLELGDGRRVVLKIHRPSVGLGFLHAVSRSQAALAEQGFPCPRPLADPRPFDGGTATLEELLDEGERRAAGPAERALMAELLARLVREAEPRPGLLRGSPLSDERRWPTPHSRIFDFDSAARGTEWIDAIADRAKRQSLDRGRRVTGHMDWSIKHFRFAGDVATVVYDWDSLALASEPEVVGQAAAVHRATWYVETRVAPTPEEASAFVADYEEERGSAFGRQERRDVAAAATYILAYSARCEACSDPLARDFPSDSVRHALATRADDFLAL